MKLEKAIEILKLMIKGEIYLLPPDFKDAGGLGIEALKRCRELESPLNYSPMRPLPGEDPK